MRKNILAVLTSAIFMISCQSFAYSLSSKSCSFPHHYTISGPTGTKIINVQIDSYPQNNLAISNATSNSFDTVLINSGNCTGGVVSLKVGTDGSHWADIILLDYQTENRINYITETNRFDLKSFVTSNSPNFQFIFVQN